MRAGAPQPGERRLTRQLCYCRAPDPRIAELNGPVRTHVLKQETQQGLAVFVGGEELASDHLDFLGLQDKPLPRLIPAPSASLVADVPLGLRHVGDDLDTLERHS